MFGSNKALWFSPSGSKLAFGYFDDSHTPIITIPFYGYPGSLTFQYTSAISIHYPKVSVRMENCMQIRTGSTSFSGYIEFMIFFIAYDICRVESKNSSFMVLHSVEFERGFEAKIKIRWSRSHIRRQRLHVQQCCV